MAGNMPCPSCGNEDTGVTDSRPSAVPVPNVKRRRKCSCGHRFTTREMLDDVDAHLFLDLRPLSSRNRALVRQMANALHPESPG